MSGNTDTRAALRRALKSLDPPTQVHLAKRMGVSQPSVWEWIQTGRVPAKRCRELEALTGVRAEELRPDIFSPVERDGGVRAKESA
ncbi:MULTISPECIES: YdaS family helix-turn-helix protein [unclassified Thioalkalivibrio]|uniref:transcriptional regulator n=1 Tax=unclassified Thioalkalivibrio TaxID=2621013 RepID=UPI000377C0B9